MSWWRVDPTFRNYWKKGKTTWFEYLLAVKIKLLFVWYSKKKKGGFSLTIHFVYEPNRFSFVVNNKRIRNVQNRHSNNCFSYIPEDVDSLENIDRVFFFNLCVQCISMLSPPVLEDPGFVCTEDDLSYSNCCSLADAFIVQYSVVFYIAMWICSRNWVQFLYVPWAKRCDWDTDVASVLDFISIWASLHRRVL